MDCELSMACQRREQFPQLISTHAFAADGSLLCNPLLNPSPTFEMEAVGELRSHDELATGSRITDLLGTCLQYMDIFWKQSYAQAYREQSQCSPCRSAQHKMTERAEMRNGQEQ